MITTLELKTPRSARKASAEQPTDLAEAVQQCLGRKVGEVVRCIPVYGNYYRCNWWSRATMNGDGSVCGRITRSVFLRVSNTADGLLIEDITAG